MTITLDPGHGRLANKGIINGYYEGTVVFKLAYLLKAELEKYQNIKVFVTRAKLDDDPSLERRGSMAVSNGSELFISLHSNAADNAKAHGVSVFRSINNPQSAILGKRLGDAVVKLMSEQTRDTYLRGVFTRTYVDGGGEVKDYYGVIRSSVKKGLKHSYIIEHGFHTNYAECAFMSKSENLKRLAVAEAKVIAEYFNCPPISEGGEEEVVYIVKRGDTLSAIARKYGVDHKELAKYNAISDPNLIYVGQKIRIMPSAPQLEEGDLVRIKPYKTTYAPGGKSFPTWVLDYDYTVAQTRDGRGKRVYKNGAECVLLGKKTKRSDGTVSSPLNTWCAREHLIKLN